MIVTLPKKTKVLFHKEKTLAVDIWNNCKTLNNSVRSRYLTVTLSNKQQLIL